MGILALMIIVSLGLAFSFLVAFIWANRDRQFEDLVTPAWRAVFDEAQKVKEGEEDV